MTSTFDPLPLGECDDPATVLAACAGAQAGRGRRRTRGAARRPPGGRRCTPVTLWSDPPRRGTSPLCRWVGRGARRWRSSRSSSSPPRWAGPPSPGAATCPTRSRAFYRLPRCWARLEAGDLQAWRLGFIAERTLCLSPAAAGVRRHPRRGGGAQDRPGPAGPADRGGQGPVRPRGHRGRTARRRRRPGTSTSGSATPGSRAGSRSTATWTWPTPWTWRPRSPPTPTTSCSWVRPSPSTYAARSRSATWPAPNSPSTSPRLPTTSPRSELTARVDRWCCTSTSSTPPSSVPAGSPGSRRPVARSPPNRSASGAPTPTPRSPSSRSSTSPSTSTSAPTRPPPGSSSRPSSATGPARSRSASDPPKPATANTASRPDPGDPERDDGGPTCSCNLAPCCRRHHRAKTTGGWTYVTVEPGVYLWRSPLGYQFLRDHTGTLDVTPDPERRRLAHTFPAHFGSRPADPEP